MSGVGAWEMVDEEGIRFREGGWSIAEGFTFMSFNKNHKTTGREDGKGYASERPDGYIKYVFGRRVPAECQFIRQQDWVTPLCGHAGSPNKIQLRNRNVVR